MVIHHINKSATVQSIVRVEYFFCFHCCRVLIRESINGPVQPNALLDSRYKIKLLFPFHIIADEVANRNFRVAKREKCMGQVVHYGTKVKYIDRKDKKGQSFPGMRFKLHLSP